MKKIILSLLAIICAFSIVGCDKKEEVKEKNQEPTSKIGYVEKATVENLVDEYNNVIENDSGLGLIDKETVSIKDGRYWYTLDNDIYLVVIPVSEQKAAKEDIVTSMRIYFTDKTLEDPQVPAYTRLLIMANNKEITNEEADKLVNEAKEKADSNLTSNNGKGISVGYAASTNHYEYQVIRNYKE